MKISTLLLALEKMDNNNINNNNIQTQGNKKLVIILDRRVIAISCVALNGG
jgi:hypothetical protein